MSVLGSVKDYMKKRKKKSDARREEATAKMKKAGPKRLKQIRGAYDNADSAFGRIHRARKAKDKMLEEITAGK